LRRLVLTWGDAAALLAVFLWGANFPVMKLLMTRVGPLPLTVLRGVVAACLLTGILGVSGQWRFPPRHERLSVLALALLGFTLNQLLYFYGLHFTTASHSGLLMTLTPLIVFGLSQLLGYIHMNRLNVLGLVLGVTGGVLIFGGPALASRPTGGATALGDLLTLGSAIAWSVWTVLSVPLLRRHGTLQVTAWVTLTGSVSLLPVALPDLLMLDWHRVGWWGGLGVLYSATAAGAFASLLWYSAVRRIGAARTAIYANLESLFALTGAAVILGERVEGVALLGGVAVIAGVLLTRRAT
jgi:drug/metabolite transporter (DMT)-like permease